MQGNSNYQPFQNIFWRVFLVRFSHPWVTLSIYVPVGFALLFWSLHLEPRPWTSVFLWMLSGVFAWTLVEYVLHRFVFHWTRVREPIRAFASGLHIAHHRDVEAQDLVLAPPLVGFLLGPAEVFIFSLATGSLARGLLIEVGLFLGYFIYEWVHYNVHFGRARGPLMKYWKSYHLYHHFKDPKRSFGVTTPLWDWIFGSARKA